MLIEIYSKAVSIWGNEWKLIQCLAGVPFDLCVKFVNIWHSYLFFLHCLSVCLFPSLCVFCSSNHWLRYMFDENSNFQNGSTSSPGNHITSCSNSKHMIYGGNGSLSVDWSQFERSFNMVDSMATHTMSLFCVYFEQCVICVNI